MSDHTAARIAERTSDRMYRDAEFGSSRIPYPPKLSPPISARASMSLPETTAAEEATIQAVDAEGPPKKPRIISTPAKNKKGPDPIEMVQSLLQLPKDRVMRHLSAQDRLELRKLTHTSDLEHRILLNPIEFVATCTVVGTLLGVLLGTLLSSTHHTISKPSPSMRGVAEKSGTRAPSAHRTIKHLLSFV